MVKMTQRCQHASQQERWLTGHVIRSCPAGQRGRRAEPCAGTDVRRRRVAEARCVPGSGRE